MLVFGLEPGDEMGDFELISKNFSFPTHFFFFFFLSFLGDIERWARHTRGEKSESRAIIELKM